MSFSEKIGLIIAIAACIYIAGLAIGLICITLFELRDRFKKWIDNLPENLKKPDYYKKRE